MTDSMNERALNTLVSATPLAGPEITIVLPTYNERANVRPMIDAIARTLADTPWEIIFVDDDSPDGTTAEARAIGAADIRVRCIRRVHRRGRGSACIEGLLAAQGKYVAVMDADLQHDDSVLPRMIKILREESADLVIGSRYVEGGSTEGLAGARATISRSAGRLAQLVLGVEISDPTSGFFAAKRELIDALARELSTEGFNTLLDIVSTRHAGMRIAEVPYVFRARQHGESKLSARVALDFAGLILSRLSFNTLPQRFLLFCIVGVSGIGVHLIALAGLFALTFRFDTAQAIAAFAAIASNFWFNNILTYRDQTLRGSAALKGLMLYAVICSFGFISNISVAQWMLTDDSTWWLAGFFGALISAVWNYAVSAALIWRR